ncbi:MAG TPA: GNAT family N-acetyltransferase [Candidatus Saccharimonadia bacterium]
MAAAHTSNPPLKIAPVRLRELAQLHRMFERAVRIHFAYFPERVQRQVIAEHSLIQLLKAYADSRRVVLVARRRGQLAGYCVAAVPPNGPAQLFWLYVDPVHRGTNTGLSLLSRAVKEMERLGAQTIFLATHDHRRYYERQGFKFDHRESQHGVDMDIMSFSIRRPA